MIAKELQGQFEMYDSCVKVLKGSARRWFDYKIHAMERVIEKFGFYVQHLNSCVATAKNSNARATVEGKLKKLVDAKVLLRAAFFTDVLSEAKRFSLITQEKNINVIKMLNAVETTKSNYERQLKKGKRKQWVHIEFSKPENCDWRSKIKWRWWWHT